jgi:phosphotransferase system IIA component
MNQMDEISLNTRTDPKMIYGIPNEFMSIALTGDEDKINEALIKLNADLLETTKKSLQPTIIINQELNKLKLIASKNLLPKINEYKVLISDFTNEFQSVLNNISTIDDWEKNAIKMQSMGQNERALRMKELWSDIENLMRDEIDYYKK